MEYLTPGLKPSLASGDSEAPRGTPNRDRDEDHNLFLLSHASIPEIRKECLFRLLSLI